MVGGIDPEIRSGQGGYDMAEARSATPAWRTARWLVRAVVCATLIWVGHWAYVRMTTPAMTLDAAYARFGPFVGFSPPPADTDRLIAAITAMPPTPPFQLPAPPGMRWEGHGADDSVLDLTDMNAGEWLPEERPYLRACVEFVASPEMEQFVGRFRALRGSTFHRAVDSTMVGHREGASSAELRQVVRMLVARSRYSCDGLRDNDRSWNDMQTVLWLAHGAPAKTLVDFLVSHATERQALYELRIQIRTAAPDESVLDEIEQTVDGLPNPLEFWSTIVANDRIETQCWAATHFADAPGGNGWLMLSEPIDPTDSRRTPLWNLLTLFQHRLHEVNSRIIAQYERVASLSAYDFPAALDVIEQPPTPAAVFTPLDGEPQFCYALTDYRLRSYQRCLELLGAQIAGREATIVIIALSRFHGAHDDYPEHLADLTPTLLRELPRDPFCGETLHYVRESDGYRLWSCYNGCVLREFFIHFL